MSRVRVTGCKDLITMLEKAGVDATAICGTCVYEGMSIVNEHFYAKLASLETQGSDSWSNKNASKRKLRDWEKQALLDGYGLAPFQRRGDKIDGRAGFEGYTISPRKPYRRVAIAAIANATNCGTSFEQAQPIFKPVISECRGAVMSAMQKQLELEIETQGLDMS